MQRANLFTMSVRAIAGPKNHYRFGGRSGLLQCSLFQMFGPKISAKNVDSNNSMYNNKELHPDSLGAHFEKPLKKAAAAFDHYSAY